MPSIPVTHLHEQGQDMVIVIMETAFARASESSKFDGNATVRMGSLSV